MRAQPTQPELYERFKALHARPEAFVMANAWDGGSAAVFLDAGFEALGTSSAALACALGLMDGRHAVSRDEHIAHARLLTELTGLPINGDLEDGFGPEPSDVVTTIEAAIAAGLAGVGIEDTTGDPDKPLHAFDAAVARIKAAAKAAQGRILLTGRTDNYLQGNPDLDDTIRRLVAFAEAGADVLYAPFLPDWDAVKAVVKAVAPKPVNLLVGTPESTLPLAEASKTGVKRISLGSDLYASAIWHAHHNALELLEGDLATGSGRKPSTSTSRGFGQIAKAIQQAKGL